MDESKGALLWATWLTEDELKGRKKKAIKIKGRKKKAVNQTMNQTIFYQLIKKPQFLQRQTNVNISDS